jgi:hypothetical protein
MDDKYDIREFFPTADHGSILITSRLQSLNERGLSLSVPALSFEDATSLLWQSMHLPVPVTTTTVEVDQGTSIFYESVYHC